MPIFSENMNPDVAHKLLKVGEAFRIPGPFFSYEEIKMGNVNHTYKVNYIRDDGSGMAKIKSYLVQRVNTYAFQRPLELMSNIDKVTEYIHANFPHVKCLHFHHTAERHNYLMDADGFWRLSNYVPSVTFNSCEDLEIVRSAGQAFGDFQMMLSKFDASSLYYTIEDFHNTRKRYATLKKDMAADPCGRVSEVREELDWLLSVEDEACKLTDLYEAGELPLRVTHNDTKLNNVLLDEKTGLARSVLDLDTVMPGLSAYDFGDAVRFGASSAAEDETDLSKVFLRLDLYRAFLEGYLDACGHALTENEISVLPLGAKIITIELGMRFLKDYLDGDVYFKIDRPAQNLDRCRAQLRLAADMEAQWPQMQQILLETAGSRCRT